MYINLNSKKVFRTAFSIIIGIYFIFGISRIFTNMPWCDEGCYTSPAVNLVRNGYLGSRVHVKDGTLLESWKHHTYFEPPLYFLAEATIFRIAGVGLFQARFLSILFGLLGLIAIYYIARRVLNNAGLPVLVTLILVSCDYCYLTIASAARPDSMSSSLAFVALACYLLLRERRLELALVVGNILVCLSGLSHPNGILGLIMLWGLAIFLDFRRIRLSYVLLSLIPYAIGAVLWGVYIAEDIHAFKSQIFYMLQLYKPAEHGIGLISSMIRREIVIRYLHAFGLSPGRTSIIPLFKLPVLAFFFANFIIAPIYIKNSKNRKYKTAQWIVLLICFFGLMFVSLDKESSYLIWITPLFILNSIGVYQELRQKSFMRRIFLLMLVYVVVISVSGQIRIILMNRYHNKYLSNISEFDTRHYKGGLIYGSNELAFYYDFDPNIILEDLTLGYYTGKKADYICLTPYMVNFLERLKYKNAGAAEYTDKLLKNEYALEFQGQFYTFYRKVSRK